MDGITCRTEEIHGTSVVLCPDLPQEEQEVLIGILRDWPAGVVRKLAAGGLLRIKNRGREEFSREFPDEAARREPVGWRPGDLVFAGADRWGTSRFTLTERMGPVLARLYGARPPSRPSSVRNLGTTLVPHNVRAVAEVLARRFASQGLRYQPSPILRADLGLHEVTGEGGRGLTYVRLQTTNPLFNRWVHDLFVEPVVPLDTSLQIYAGLFSTVSSNPFGLIGAVAWGVEAEVKSFEGAQILLDSNLQHRVRTSPELPSDRLLIETTLKFQSTDRSASFGVTASTSLLGSPDPRLGLSGAMVF